ncbi:hypothetical protein DYU11_20860 [Fibrisoma montanum]|uniref:Uncharacterized protein n=2 Tax=Fibrisoma montanum TaxID=2305895 RepID=A0A418M410_9BACT|nr:hypothetical protein DYU11_20860 [Fibrisoma montanum]
MLPPTEPSIQSALDTYHDAIHEMVCYGTHILHWILKENKKILPESTELNIAHALLFRHILEHLDSMAIQIKASAIVPSKVQLRVILEAFLSLEYLLEKPENIAQRAAAYFLVGYYKSYNFLMKHTPGTEEYRIQMEDLKKHAKYIRDEDLPDTSAELENIKRLINSPLYREAKEEYNIYTKDNTKDINDLKWHALYNGPKSTFRLANYLNRRDFYDYCYKPWSEEVHSTNLHRGVIVKAEEGYGAFNQLRMPDQAPELVQSTTMIVLSVYELLITKCVPKELNNYRQWSRMYKMVHRNKVERIKFNLVAAPNPL